MRHTAIAGLLLAAAVTAWPQKNAPQAPRPKPDIARLQQLSPAQRKSALQGLPPQRRQRIEQRLNRLDQMDPAQRERLLERLQKFQALPRERQNEIRELGRRVQALPEDRRQQVRGAINRLSKLPEAERERRLALPRFQEGYSSEELEMIRRGAGLWHEALEPETR